MAVDLNNSDLNALMEALKRQGFSAAQAGYIAGIDPGQRQQAYDTYVNELVPQIGATELAQIQAQRDQLRNNYAQQLAQLNYQQSVSDQNYGASKTNLMRQFDQMREKLPYGYNARGLMNSGVYSQGLQDYGDQRVRSLGDFEMRRQQQQGDFGLRRNQMESGLSSGLGSLDQLEKSRRAQLAAQIKAAK